MSLKGLERTIQPIDLKWKDYITEFYTSSHLTELNKHFLDYINFV